jgi:hypothetical protein
MYSCTLLLDEALVPAHEWKSRFEEYFGPFLQAKKQQRELLALHCE